MVFKWFQGFEPQSLKVVWKINLGGENTDGWANRSYLPSCRHPSHWFPHVYFWQIYIWKPITLLRHLHFHLREVFLADCHDGSMWTTYMVKLSNMALWIIFIICLHINYWFKILFGFLLKFPLLFACWNSGMFGLLKSALVCFNKQTKTDFN